MRQSWPRSSSRANHTLENHSNVNEASATAFGAVLPNFCEATALKCHAHFFNARVPPLGGKDMCPALPALTSRQLVRVNLVSVVGKTVT